MRLRIFSNGDLGDFRVENAETGERIENVRGVYIQLEQGDASLAAIEIAVPKVDVIADTQRIDVCPHCGREDFDLQKQSDEQPADAPATPESPAEPQWWDAVEDCANCGTAPQLTSHAPKPDPMRYTEIRCHSCGMACDAPNFETAHRIWKELNEAAAAVKKGQDEKGSQDTN